MRLILPLLIAWLVVVGDARSKLPAREAPIDFKVTPYICLVPCAVRIDAIVPPKAENRSAVIELDGPMFLSHMTELNGLDGPKRFTFVTSDLMAGEYEIRADLFTVYGFASRRSQRLIVRGAQP